MICIIHNGIKKIINGFCENGKIRIFHNGRKKTINGNIDESGIHIFHNGLEKIVKGYSEDAPSSNTYRFQESSEWVFDSSDNVYVAKFYDDRVDYNTDSIYRISLSNGGNSINLSNAYDIDTFTDETGSGVFVSFEDATAIDVESPVLCDIIMHRPTDTEICVYVNDEWTASDDKWIIETGVDNAESVVSWAASAGDVDGAAPVITDGVLTLERSTEPESNDNVVFAIIYTVSE